MSVILPLSTLCLVKIFPKGVSIYILTPSTLNFGKGGLTIMGVNHLVGLKGIYKTTKLRNANALRLTVWLSFVIYQ